MHALVTLPPEIIGSLRLCCTQHTIAYRMHHEEPISCVLNVQRQQSPFSKLKHSSTHKTQECERKDPEMEI